MDTRTYIAYFKNSSDLWRRMEETVEASPWHRESSTAVHTEMVLEQYETRFAAHRTDEQNTVARMALLFHDVGKPNAEEVLQRKDGSGTYRRYAGHEQHSAVLFTETYLTDSSLRSLLTVEQARQVRFIIEHHLPYDLKDARKRSDLRTALVRTLGYDAQTFYDCLRSDAAGRISDDHETKLQKVEDWIAEFQTVPLTSSSHSKSGTCYLMIGPSGSGKSTFTRSTRRETDYVLSLDDYRMRFAPITTDAPKDQYAEAFEYCVQHDAQFRAFVNADIQHVFFDSFKSLKAQPFRSVFIDNTNGSRKVRAQYVQAARSIGMRIVAVEFWTPLAELLARQRTRSEKAVPESSVRQQYLAQTCALLGSEADSVLVKCF